MTAVALTPPPLPLSAFYPPRSQGRGLLVPAAEPVLGDGGRGGTLSVSNTGFLDYSSPSPHALNPNPGSLLPVLIKYTLKVLCCGDLKALYRHWSDGSLLALGTGRRQRAQDLAGAGPRQAPSSRGPQDRPPLRPWPPWFLSSPSQHLGMRERERITGSQARDGAKAVQVWVKRIPPHPCPKKGPCPEGTPSPSCT